MAKQTTDSSLSSNNIISIYEYHLQVVGSTWSLIMPTYFDTRYYLQIVGGNAS